MRQEFLAKPKLIGVLGLWSAGWRREFRKCPSYSGPIVGFFKMPAFGRTLPQNDKNAMIGRMGNGRTRSTTPDLFSTASARFPSPSVNSPSSTPSYALPKNLPDAIRYLDDDQLDRLLAAALAEQRRRGKNVPVSDNSPRKALVKVDAPPLPQGKLNAIRAAFKAGFTPSRIARQFRISKSDVKKALASPSRGSV